MAGAGYKLFTTGSVLTAAEVNTYLNEQTVMVFNDATARTTALSGVLAEGMVTYLKSTKVVEIYNGTAWASLDDPNAIQNTIVDAKGDLITATAADTPARLAVGNNGETLVADSSATTGLRWQGNFAAGKNVILNSDFRIAQRGTTFTAIADTAYSLDRWQIRFDGSGVRTISQQTFTPGTAPVSGYEGANFFRYNQTTAGSGATFGGFQQKIEDVRTFANQTVTLSFWGKADAARTVETKLEQNFGSGGSASVFSIGSTNHSFTTNWQRFSVTFTIPSISGKTIGTSSFLLLYFGLPINTLQTIDIWGVQLEAGSVATAFQTATGTLAGELAACQRYYYRNVANGAFTLMTNMGAAETATNCRFIVQHPVTMRVAPTTIEYSTLIVYSPSGGTNSTVSSFSTVYGGAQHSLMTAGVTGLTANASYFLYTNNSTAGYIAFGAEL